MSSIVFIFYTLIFSLSIVPYYNCVYITLSRITRHYYYHAYLLLVVVCRHISTLWIVLKLCRLFSGWNKHATSVVWGPANYTHWACSYCDSVDRRLSHCKTPPTVYANHSSCCCCFRDARRQEIPVIIYKVFQKKTAQSFAHCNFFNHSP